MKAVVTRLSLGKLYEILNNNSDVNFSDCLIGRQNASHECKTTYTFDKKAAKKLSVLFHLIADLS